MQRNQLNQANCRLHARNTTLNSFTASSRGWSL